METGKDENGDASSPAKTRTEGSSPGRPDTRVPSIPGKESTADSDRNSRPRRTAGSTRSTRSSSTIKRGSAGGRIRRRGRCTAGPVLLIRDAFRRRPAEEGRVGAERQKQADPEGGVGQTAPLVRRDAHVRHHRGIRQRMVREGMRRGTSLRARARGLAAQARDEGLGPSGSRTGVRRYCPRIHAISSRGRDRPKDASRRR